MNAARCYLNSGSQEYRKFESKKAALGSFIVVNNLVRRATVRSGDDCPDRSTRFG